MEIKHCISILISYRRICEQHYSSIDERQFRLYVYVVSRMYNVNKRLRSEEWDRHIELHPRRKRTIVYISLLRFETFESELIFVH